MSLTPSELADIRKVEPLYRENMSAEELKAEKDEVARWEANYEAWLADGNLPASELLVDHRTEQALLMQRRRNRRYRKNKYKQRQPCVTVPMQQSL